MRLQLFLDRDILEASGQDPAHVQVRAVDADGLLVPNTQHHVRFRISSFGSIAGVHNGNLGGPHPFKAKHCRMYNGRCLVIVQSAREPGTIRLFAQ